MVPYTNESSHFWLAGTTTATATAGGGGDDDDVDHDHDDSIPSRNSSSSTTSRNEKQKKEYYHSHRRKQQQQQENHHYPREGTARATTSDTTASLVVVEEGTADRGRREDKIWSLALPWIAIVMVAIISALLQLALRTKQQQQEEEQMTTTTTFMMMGEDFQDEDDEEEKDYSSFFSSIDNNHSNRDLQQQEEQLEGVVVDDEDYTTHNTHTHHHQVYNEDHDPLYPLSSDDKIGFFLATLGLMVAAGGGIGGGGILVPIYILVMGFSPKHAIPLSNITVFGGSIANTILNTRKRHPLADRPLVDWDLILVMEPLTIAGALIGAFLNKVLPEMLLTIMLVVLLSFTAYNSLKKAMKMYKKETIAMKAISGINPIDGSKESELTRAIDEQNNEQQIEAAEKLLQQENGNENENDDGGAFIKKEEYMTDEEKDLIALLEEEKVTPPTNLTILIVMFIVIIAINLLKGGGAFPSPIGITCGSFSFWIANFIMLLWILIISIYVRILLIRKYNRKQQCSFPYVEGDIKWDSRATIIYPVICCLAGFFAGMFGVGGGIVKGPLMLAMGVHPAVSSASSACMILFTSFTATTSFLVFGLLVPDYGVVCLCIGFVATLFGQIGLGYLMKRAQRNSYIAFSIGFVVLLSAFLMTIQSLLSMAEGEHHHAGGICGKGD